jgi:hypothetical protein
MKGSHPQIPGCFGTGYRGNPVLHFACCLIGKGKGKYPACAHTSVQQMCYPVSKNTGFSGTSSGNDQGGAFGIDNRFPLGFIQFVKIIRGHELFGITDCRDGKFNEINFSGRESSLFMTFFYQQKIAGRIQPDSVHAGRLCPGKRIFPERTVPAG